MASNIILNNPILTKFAYPFLLVFFLVFAVLEKTKLLGEDRKQLNALISFVIGLVLISATTAYRMAIENMVLFLSVALVIMFVVMLLWGFIFSKEGGGFEFTPSMKWGLFAVVTIAIIIAILWATGVSGGVYDFFFKQSWSEAFWTNFFFIVLIAIALGVVVKGAK